MRAPTSRAPSLVSWRQTMSERVAICWMKASFRFRRSLPWIPRACVERELELKVVMSGWGMFVLRLVAALGEACAGGGSANASFLAVASIRRQVSCLLWEAVPSGLVVSDGWVVGRGRWCPVACAPPLVGPPGGAR